MSNFVEFAVSTGLRYSYAGAASAVPLTVTEAADAPGASEKSNFVESSLNRTRLCPVAAAATVPEFTMLLVTAAAGSFGAMPASAVTLTAASAGAP